MHCHSVLKFAQFHAVITRKPWPGVDKLRQLFLLRGGDATVVDPPAERQRAQRGEDGDED